MNNKNNLPLTRFGILITVLVFLIFFQKISVHKLKSQETKRPFISSQILLRQGRLQKSLIFNSLALEQNALGNHKLVAGMQNFRSKKKFREFAFTFDLGTNPGQLDYILKTLKKHKVQATFFITGKFCKKFPGKTREILYSGHEVGNHTFNHPYLKNKAHLKRELLETERIFFKTTGKAIAPYWRSPYFQEDSLENHWMITYAHKLGYIHFNATIDSKDWTFEKHPCYISGKEFYEGFTNLNISNLPAKRRFSFCKSTLKRFKRKTKFDTRGAIILMHPKSMRKKDFLVLQLDKIITFLKKKKYSVVTLSELMNDREKKFQ